MNLFLGIIEGIREIRAHKFRSFLTMLGVILGVASLMATFALTAGIASGARTHLNEVGGVEMIDIHDASPPDSQQAIKEISPGRTRRDTLALKRSVPLVRYASGEVDLGGARVARAGKRIWPRLLGAEPDFFPVENHRLAAGRFITDLDVEMSNRVVVIGDEVVQRLWDEENIVPLGEKILINGEHFTIVGVLERYVNEMHEKRKKLLQKKEKDNSKKGRNTGKGWDPFHWKNRTVAIPITTMQSLFKTVQMQGGVDQGPDLKLTRLRVKISDVKRFNDVVDQMRNVLLFTHRGIRDFRFETREEWFASIENSVQSMKLSGGLIAGIGLLVGGLGITNIMLASISQRVREIGIRRAVGAKPFDIFSQILIEGIVLAVMGGLLGLLVGVGLVQLLILLAPAQNNPIIEPQAVLVSLASAVLIGIVAGIYPAWKASQLSPIEALRYE